MILPFDHQAVGAGGFKLNVVGPKVHLIILFISLNLSLGLCVDHQPHFNRKTVAAMY